MNDELPQTPMVEELPPVVCEPTPAERAEAAATRRRWVTLAEVVAIGGLVIAAISLWLTWSDRRADQTERAAERAVVERTQTIVTLTATRVAGGDALVLKDAAHEIQTASIRFPAALGVAAHEAVIEPRIDAGWFAKAILAATDHGPDVQQGRLPVLITASYWDGDVKRSGSAIYDLVWQTEGRFLRGRALKLKGILLRERTSDPKRLDALWSVPKR